MTAFGWLSKCAFFSQGGFENGDTHRKFETTDQREWMFACPACKTEQPYKWDNVRWDSDCKLDNGEYDFRKVRESVRLVCEHCGHELHDLDETRRKLNGAAALGIAATHGSIAVGKAASLIVYEPWVPSPDYIPYAYTKPLIRQVILKGECV